MNRKKRAKKLFNLLLLLFFVTQLQILGQLLQAFAIVQLDFTPSAIELLELLNQRDLRLDTNVQTSQLLVQLKSNVCEGEKEMECDVRNGSFNDVPICGCCRRRRRKKKRFTT